MRTRKDFEQLIKDNLQGVVWRRLRNGLLGQELISFGGVVNELQEAQFDNFIKSLSPENADYAGLAILGLNQFINYDILRPTIAQIEITPTSDIRPFSAVLQIGATKFYNKDFYAAGKETVLQFYRSTYQSTSLSKESFNEGLFIISGTYVNGTYTYLKLPADTLVDSLRVYLIAPNGESYPQQFGFVPGQQNNVRVWRSLDNMLNVGVKSMEGFIDLRCTFLVGSEASPDAENGTLTYNGNSTQVTATIDAGDRSIDAARQSFIRHIGMTSSVSTRDQIKQFVNDFPQVEDCMPEVTDLNTITVWVKPANNRSLSPIQEALTVYGELAIKWVVSLGVEVPFGVLISQVDTTLTSEQKAEIVTLIGEWIKDKLQYTTVVTPAWLFLAVIDYAAAITLAVTLNQKVEGSVVALLASPIETTIVLTKNGKDIGWDSRGYLRAYANSQSYSTAKVISKIQENYMALLPTADNKYQAALIDTNGNAVAISTSLWNIQDFWLPGTLSSTHTWQLIQSTNYILILSKSSSAANATLRGKLFSIDVRFGQETNSLIKDPEQNVSWTFPTAGEWVDMQVFNLSKNEAPDLMIDTDLYMIKPTDNNAYLQIARYALSADTLLYEKVTALSVQAMTLDSYVVKGYCVAQWGDAVLVVTSLYDGTKSSNKSILRIYWYSLDITTVQQVNDEQLNIVLGDISQREITGVQISGSALYLRVKNLTNAAKSDFYRVNLNIIGSTSSRYVTAEAPTLVVEGSSADKLVLFGEEWSDDNKVVNLLGEEIFDVTASKNWMSNVGLVDYTRRQLTLDNSKYYTYFKDSRVSYQTTKVELEKVRNYPVLKDGITWK